MKRSVNIAKLTLSDSRSLEQVTSGQSLVDMAARDGHIVVGSLLMPDDICRIRYEMSRWILDTGIEDAWNNSLPHQLDEGHRLCNPVELMPGLFES